MSSGGLGVHRGVALLRGEDLPQVVNGELVISSTWTSIGAHHELGQRDLLEGFRILVARRVGIIPLDNLDTASRLGGESTVHVSNLALRSVSLGIDLAYASILVRKSVDSVGNSAFVHWVGNAGFFLLTEKSVSEAGKQFGLGSCGALHPASLHLSIRDIGG